MDYKREVFFVKIPCHIFESKMSMIPDISQIDRTGVGDVPPKVLLRTTLSVCFFQNRIGRAVICHGTTKER